MVVALTHQKLTAMKKNLSLTDKTIRIAIAVLIAVLYLTSIITGTLAIILLAVAVIFFGTGVVGFCPIYKMLNISTRKEDKLAKH